MKSTEKHYNNLLILSEEIKDRFNAYIADYRLFDFINQRALKTLSIETPFGYESIDISELPEWKRKYLTFFIKDNTIPNQFGGDYECYLYILNRSF